VVRSRAVAVVEIHAPKVVELLHFEVVLQRGLSIKSGQVPVMLSLSKHGPQPFAHAVPLDDPEVKKPNLAA
jgi:hypothetical protein